MFNFLTTLPLSIIYLISVLLILLALSCGYLVGHRLARQRADQQDSSIGSAVAAMLGLLAFMLALTFNMTSERFSERKALLLDEVNAIETTFLRADFLPAAERAQVRQLLREYAEVRSTDPTRRSMAETFEAMVRSEEIHGALWQLLGSSQDNDAVNAIHVRAFYESLNEVIDLHSKRVQVGLIYQIPGAIWAALYTISALAVFGLGVQLGINARGSAPVAISLALAFALVILLIADLDRAGEGLLVVNQEPMRALAERMTNQRQ
ncbi:bestrophin-like domain [Microbulbifer agarilyticus]|uniref:bestrophin-like domain n=1 Tax=Microbulbifer agarilyticus TaxID=260552 RepID=UPI001C97074D|nr:hypothetical protein [Microbulbifer agarilyticus]MBY6191027.1 hypothetical protein [Microbulbifer agarilyticus]MBY6211633.1 hypothetical protein [Microbulbifer agarilyticus]MCA0893348.1 hypothetical protein [Microbulbifer agarilyticus]